MYWCRLTVAMFFIILSQTQLIKTIQKNEKYYRWSLGTESIYTMDESGVQGAVDSNPTESDPGYMPVTFSCNQFPKLIVTVDSTYV